MKVEDLWNRYRQINPGAESYEAWSFAGGGKIGDELADLVLKGLKTATASAYAIYEVEKAPIPSAGALSIILKSIDDAVCIIRTTNILICEFRDVSPEHAYCEGEGDRSLEYWRMVHRECFTEELASHGLSFDEGMLVVCETFVLEFIAVK
jgi:uncharacterized protein YhfF